MRKLLVASLLLASFTASLTAHANDALVLDTPATPDPAITQFAADRMAPGQVRTLTLAAAKQLLSSTEGPAWRVVSTQGPACALKNRKACKPVKRACLEAKKFAKKYRVHATCSTLYQQSTALLTTVPAAKKRK